MTLNIIFSVIRVTLFHRDIGIYADVFLFFMDVLMADGDTVNSDKYICTEHNGCTIGSYASMIQKISYFTSFFV